MAISKKAIYKTRLAAIKSELGDYSKDGFASKAMLDDFNDLLEKIAAEFPDVADELPKRVVMKGTMADLNLTNVTILDIRSFAEQAVQLVALCPD